MRREGGRGGGAIESLGLRKEGREFLIYKKIKKIKKNFPGFSCGGANHIMIFRKKLPQKKGRAVKK